MHITKDELLAAHTALIEFANDFEILYYQRNPARLHFVRPAIHTVCHLAMEVVRMGPGICSSQWTMERTIGNLGEEVKQHSNPFANLSQRGLRQSQVNALKAMVPDLDPPEKQFPYGAVDLGDGYGLLRKMDRTARPVRPLEAIAIQQYMQEHGETCDLISVVRWARLRLPNGQTARSAWKESLSPLNSVRISRNVKFHNGNTYAFGEVYFYFRWNMGNQFRTLALVSLYGPPDPDLIKASYMTLYSCRPLGDMKLTVIDAKSIISIVAMVPHRRALSGVPDDEERVFVVEKPGLDVADIGGIGEALTDE